MLGVGRHLGRWSFVLGGLVLAAGCGQSTLGATCRSNDDCGSDERCETSMVRSEQPIYGPCPYAGCQQQSDCTNGYVCAPPSQWLTTIQPGQNCFPKVCGPPCDPDNSATCPADMLCREDGSCSYLQCDEAGGITCPEHWICDPAAAPNEPREYINATTPLRGTTVVDPPDLASLTSHGCVRKRCTEADGYTCNATNVCDETQFANGSGCVPGDCKEIGRCSDDDLFICEPTSTGPHDPAMDENGCTYRNCEEGRACTLEPDDPWHFCDPSDPTADAIGCAVVPCTEGSPCPTQWVCDPSGKFPDRQGCVRDPALSAGGASGAGGTASSSGGAGASNGGATASMGGATAATGSGAETSGGESSNGGGTGGGDTSGGTSGSGGSNTGGPATGGASSESGGTSGSSASGDPPSPGRCVAR